MICLSLYNHNQVWCIVSWIMSCVFYMRLKVELALHHHSEGELLSTTNARKIHLYAAP